MNENTAEIIVESLSLKFSDEKFIAFAEKRTTAITSFDRPLARWLSETPGGVFRDDAFAGEYFTFQIAVISLGSPIRIQNVSFSPLTSAGGSISGQAAHCIHTDGTDCLGRPFHKAVSVSPNAIQPLWIGIDIPESIGKGVYEGTVRIDCGSSGAKEIEVKLSVLDTVIQDRGDHELWRHSRLRWLNSDIAIDDEITEPYIPLSLDGRTVKCLGRSLSLDDFGLPSAIRAGFDPPRYRTGYKDRNILHDSFRFHAVTESGPLAFVPEAFDFTRIGRGSIQWRATGRVSGLQMEVLGSMEYDGYVRYSVLFNCGQDMSFEDIRLDIRCDPHVARYIMGMDAQGGLISSDLDWKWNPDMQQDSLWIGDVDAGFQMKLMASDYVKPFSNIYYRHRPLVMPESWDNHGAGGCRLTVGKGDQDAVAISAYSGSRRAGAGQSLQYDFELLITPVKPLDLKKHWRTRYYHNGNGALLDQWVDGALSEGSNIINVHHGNDLNPYINYPFVETDDLKAFVEKAHRRGLKVKVYYTIRELSNHIEEFWALRSLGDEIFPQPVFKAEGVPGQGGADSWLVDHVGTSVIPAWKHVFHAGKYKGEVDASIITDSMSRLDNYYLEGLKWLLRNVDIDGIYIDDLGYDRTVMRRVRKILDRTKPGCLIDLHSWNHYEGKYGAGWASCANLYMQLFPYIDSIWFGESFDYENSTPDYWMTEISGLPYGLTGEMLQNGGNPWRGMLYGMTNRPPWRGASPKGIWELWDRFGIEDATMMGYWLGECPVKTDCPDITATVYLRRERALIAIASWAHGEKEFSLLMDSEKLNLDIHQCRLVSPEIPGLQPYHEWEIGSRLHLAPNKGMILELGYGE